MSSHILSHCRLFRDHCPHSEFFQNRVDSLQHYIIAHKQTQLNRVCYFDNEFQNLFSVHRFFLFNLALAKCKCLSLSKWIPFELNEFCIYRESNPKPLAQQASEILRFQNRIVKDKHVTRQRSTIPNLNNDFKNEWSASMYEFKLLAVILKVCTQSDTYQHNIPQFIRQAKDLTNFCSL